MRRRGRKPEVVDTNVPVVANRRHNESYACASRCAQALLSIKNLGTIVIDAADLVLAEYRANCSLAGQPGVGDSFIRWVHDNRGRGDLVHTVALTSKNGATFEEFPNHPDLAAFDPQDRKFVALANAHKDKPVILEATDSKWWGWKDALSTCGIRVEFLCPDELREAYHRKMG